MYDELIKRLREGAISADSGNEISESLYSDILQAADAIEQLSNAGSAYGRGWTLGYDAGREENKPSWIPVTERLPEPYTSVLLYSGEDLYTGYMHSDKRFTVNTSHFPYRPTHWMPLPEPPKES